MPPKKIKKKIRYSHLKRCEKTPLVYTEILQTEENLLLKEKKNLNKELVMLNYQLEELVLHLRENLTKVLSRKIEGFKGNCAEELVSISESIDYNREIKTKALLNLQNAQIDITYNDYVSNVHCTVNYFNDLKETRKKLYRDKIKLKNAQIDKLLNAYNTKILRNNENILYPTSEMLAIVK